MSFMRSRIYSIVLAALIVVPALSGQQPEEAAAAPVPSQIISARKVFISNAGADIASQSSFKRAGEPNQAFNHFYSAMRGWGRYELVSTPGEADLVLELRFTAPMYVDGTLPFFEPQFGLNILDAKTHFLLWNLTVPVGGALREKTWVKNFDHGLDTLMDDLKNLTARPVASAEPVKK